MSDIESQIIRISGNKDSEKYANWCWQTASANINPKYFEAITPSEVEGLDDIEIEYNKYYHG